MPKGNATVQAYKAEVMSGELKLNFVGLRDSSKCATSEAQAAQAAANVTDGSVLVAAHKLGYFKTQYHRLNRDR